MGFFRRLKNISNFTYTGSFAIIAFLLMVILPGCATGISGQSVVIKGQNGYTQDSRVIIDNANLGWCIKIAELKSSFVGDLMNTNVKLVSQEDSTLNLQYKFLWYNAQGAEISSGSSPWLPLIIYGRETKQVHSVAPDPSAREFKIELRFQN